MPRALTLGNGSMLVNLDRFGFVRDLYYPYVGLENHVGRDYAHRIGVWVDGAFSWLDDGAWDIRLGCRPEALASDIRAEHPGLGIALSFADLCANSDDVFIRRIEVANLSAKPRDIRIFFNQQFEPAESQSAHTALFDPAAHAVIHYRNRRAFLANAQLEGRKFNDYSTGLFRSEGREGTYCDAEDGVLAKNPIEHGRVDSVIGLSAAYKPKETKNLYYWLAAAESIEEAVALNETVIAKGPGYLMESAGNYWHAWLHRRDLDFCGLSDHWQDLFNRSLLYIKAHADNGGSIIASSDGGMLQQGKDTYAYVWPRDAAYAASALGLTGDFTAARRFFEFAERTISEGGYFMHKYAPDASLGSSWHAWTKGDGAQLPIQEDETAAVLWSLWEYYDRSRDLEFVESVYDSLIKKAADFLVLYRDEATNLPKPSFDLWEERYGVHAYTCAAVYGALSKAARFAKILGKIKNEFVYAEAAREVKEAAFRYFYSAEEDAWSVTVEIDGETVRRNGTVDASTLYGLAGFGLLEPEDPRFASLFEKTAKALAVQTAVGGFCRYQGDAYYRANAYDPSNPWFISGLWLAQCSIARAKTKEDLAFAESVLDWTVRHASSAGILSEQLDALTGEQLSAGPLVWSHAEFVRTLLAYRDRKGLLKLC